MNTGRHTGRLPGERPEAEARGLSPAGRHDTARRTCDRYRDASAYDAVLAREREDVQRLREVRA